MVDKIHYTFRWNSVISFFAADLTPYMVQITLQFKEAPFVTNDGYTNFSTSISVIILITYLTIIAVGLFQVNRKRLQVPDYLGEAKQKLKDRIDREKFPSSLTIYIEDFKIESIFDMNFLLIAKLEDIILSLNYVFMQTAPLAQCYIFTVITGFWLLMVIIAKPFRSRLATVILLFNESVKLGLGIIAIVLATNETKYFIDPDMMLTVGEVMIWTIVGTFGINTLISIGCALHAGYKICKICWKLIKRKKPPQKTKQTRITDQTRVTDQKIRIMNQSAINLNDSETL